MEAFAQRHVGGRKIRGATVVATLGIAHKVIEPRETLVDPRASQEVAFSLEKKPAREPNLRNQRRWVPARLQSGKAPAEPVDRTPVAIATPLDQVLPIGI